MRNPRAVVPSSGAAPYPVYGLKTLPVRALRQKMLQALSDGTSALTDLRVAVRMDDRAQVRKALAEVGKSRKTFNDLQQGLQ